MTGSVVGFRGSVVARFWAKVDRGADDECWSWTAATSRQGYGIFWVKPTMVQAHRLSYKMHVGEIPEGLQIDHLCRNPPCVNPGHMEVVTSGENTLRGFSPSAIHARKTRCLRGHPFDEENTYRSPDGRRGCRACTNRRARERHGNQV